VNAQADLALEALHRRAYDGAQHIHRVWVAQRQCGIRIMHIPMAEHNRAMRELTIIETPKMMAMSRRRLQSEEVEARRRRDYLMTVTLRNAHLEHSTRVAHSGACFFQQAGSATSQ
jgi:hypothetical protein